MASGQIKRHMAQRYVLSSTATENTLVINGDYRAYDQIEIFGYDGTNSGGHRFFIVIPKIAFEKGDVNTIYCPLNGSDPALALINVTSNAITINLRQTGRYISNVVGVKY